MFEEGWGSEDPHINQKVDDDVMEVRWWRYDGGGMMVEV